MEALSKAKLKQFSALHEKKYRQRDGMFLAMGWKVLAEALAAGMQPVAVVMTEGETVLQILPPACPVYSLPAHELRRLSGQEQPEGVVAVLPMPTATLIAPTAVGHVLLLHHIADPGNLGTILRTAAWFGCVQVVCGTGCADVYSPKVVRATMGALFRLKVQQGVDLLPWVAGSPHRVLAAHMEGLPLAGLQPQPHDRLLMGSESHGIDDRYWQLARVQPIHIPGSGLAESLNVAVATGILLHAWHK